VQGLFSGTKKNFNPLRYGFAAREGKTYNHQELKQGENSMSQNVHERIKHLIEGTHEAFEAYGTINSDYAEFASMALSEFKSALQQPDLTGQELRLMIRKGQSRRNSVDPNGCWATFMAHYVSSHTNSNQMPATPRGSGADDL
jgi:hypothetical protein